MENIESSCELSNDSSMKEDKESIESVSRVTDKECKLENVKEDCVQIDWVMCQNDLCLSRLKQAERSEEQLNYENIILRKRMREKDKESRDTNNRFAHEKEDE